MIPDASAPSKELCVKSASACVSDKGRINAFLFPSSVCG